MFLCVCKRLCVYMFSVCVCLCVCMCMCVLASSPRPIPNFSMLHAEKREGLVHEVTCSVSWWSIVTWHDANESRSIEVNQTGPFLHYPCLLSTINYGWAIEGSPLLVWQRYNSVLSFASCSTHKPSDLWPARWSGPSLSITWLRIPGPPSFQRATLKSWEWAWRLRVCVCVHACVCVCVCVWHRKYLPLFPLIPTLLAHLLAL